METKITLMLFVFLVVCLAGKGLYVRVTGIVAQNKGNPDDSIIERFFCAVNLLKDFVGFAKGIWTSRLTGSVSKDIGIPVPENQSFFSGNVLDFDVVAVHQYHKCVVNG